MSLNLCPVLVCVPSGKGYTLEWKNAAVAGVWCAVREGRAVRVVHVGQGAGLTTPDGGTLAFKSYDEAMGFIRQLPDDIDAAMEAAAAIKKAGRTRQC